MNLYLQMYDEPEIVDAVMKHLVDYYASANERIFAAAGSSIDILIHRQRPRQPERPAAQSRAVRAVRVATVAAAVGRFRSYS